MEDGLSNVALTANQYKRLLALIGKEKQEHLNVDTCNSSQSFLVGMTCSIISTIFKWIIDSGASNHMCLSRNTFEYYVDLLHESHYITIPNGRHIRVRGKGTIRLEFGIVLSEVLYVPNFHFNLISIHRLCKELNCVVSFTSNTCYIRDPLMKRHQVLYKQNEGLYYAQEVRSNGCDAGDSGSKNKIDMSCSVVNSMHKQNNLLVTSNIYKKIDVCLSLEMENNIKLWHNWLRRPSFKQLEEMFPDFKSFHAHNGFVCTIVLRQNKLNNPFLTISSIKHNISY